MRTRLLLLTLALAFAAPLAAARPGPPDDGSGLSAVRAWAAVRPAAGEPVELRVRAGWACLFDGEQRVWFTPLDAPTSLPRGFYLELGTASQVELSWSGSASVRLQGATGCFVEPAAQPFGGREITFRRLGQADFDVRRGALTVALPRGQRLMPAAGLFRLSGHPGGRVDLLHHAGAPIELDVGARYTFPLRAGTHRTLPECLAPPTPLLPLAAPSAFDRAPAAAASASVPSPYRGRVEVLRSTPRR